MKSKGMNKFLKLGIHCVCAIVLIVAVIVTNVILKPMEEQISSFLSQPIVDEEALAVSSASRAKAFGKNCRGRRGNVQKRERRASFRLF